MSESEVKETPSLPRSGDYLLILRKSLPGPQWSHLAFGARLSDPRAKWKTKPRLKVQRKGYQSGEKSWEWLNMSVSQPGCQGSEPQRLQRRAAAGACVQDGMQGGGAKKGRGGAWKDGSEAPLQHLTHFQKL